MLREPTEIAVQEFVRTGRAGREPAHAPVAARDASDDLETAAPATPFGLRLLQRVYLFVCGENTSRSPVAQAICNCEVARLLRLQPGERNRVRSAECRSFPFRRSVHVGQGH